ncbi:EmrB/QacA subfamily drug resistance transporter [Candidatus Jidaibacter acanthamoeba]|uniref:EmrB/QacA subfamily drug resistance transporter n=1 Tax=Candidatus Jidaibacter acanthamoebae TaxID=86105 RepID=A0A0C1QIK6_9RICK|nr:DHA2 family efflux MFS transporter permease subunit [Candidatus Jidaibacter acanthamoeba]KIE05344.1 EmrB/QacA subfamily drug resistance transporter [Candidatus Jidaibacter acanthamoeba]
MRVGIQTLLSNQILVTISVMLAAIMQTLDTTIANVALPYMQSILSATQDQITWVLTSYIVAAAIMTLPTGILSIKLGRKKYFIWSIIGFTVSSMLCGTALSLTEMVLFRMLQGVFGAALVPLSQAILLDSYPKEKHGVAMAMWGFGIMVGPILGPTLGGYLTEYYSWRWVFFINLPFGILALLGVIVSVADEAKSTNQKFNISGFLLVSIAVGALQLMLDRGEIKGWFSSTEIVIETAIAFFAFYLFIMHLFNSKTPFITPGLFLDRNFVASVIMVSIIGIILYASLSLLTPFLQSLKGYPVLTTGLVLAPRGVGTMVAMIIVGRLITRVDTRMLITFGLVLILFSLWQMINFSLDVNISPLVESGLIQGFGFGFVFVPLSTIAFSTINSAQRTEAASLYSLMRNIGSSVGISISTNILAEKTQMMHAVISESITPFNHLLHSSLFPSAWDINTIKGLASLNNEITKQAQSIAYINDFAFLMYICAASLPLVLLLKKTEIEKKADISAIAD